VRPVDAPPVARPWLLARLTVDVTIGGLESAAAAAVAGEREGRLNAALAARGVRAVEVRRAARAEPVSPAGAVTASTSAAATTPATAVGGGVRALLAAAADMGDSEAAP
jgi:hypothetical protein